MNGSAYQLLAMRTQADQAKILERLVALGPKAMQLDNASRGLTDEAGEISAVVKNYIEYGKTLDVENLKEEVGDVLWRLAQVCDAAGFSMDEAMEANVRKLAVRYPHRYSDALADPEKRDRTAERVAVSSTDSPPKLVQDGHGFGHVEYDDDPKPTDY